MFMYVKKEIRNPNKKNKQRDRKPKNRLYKTGLGNIRLAGHLRPANHHNVAREHFFRLIKHLQNAT